MSKKSSGGKSTPMTQKAASRIHSTEAKQNGGKVSSDSFTSRAERAAGRNSQGS